MKQTMRWMAVLMAAMMLALCLGCAKTAEAPAAPAEPAAPAADDDWSYIKGKGTMVIGVTIFDPMNYYDESGKLVGFDTEYAEAVCAKLGVTPEFIVINWDTKEVELAGKTIDCIWNGLTVTEDRKTNMAFTDSYIKNKQVIVMQANAQKIADLESFSYLNLVAEVGSAGESAIKENESLSKANYTAVAKQTDALLEVKAGTADAAVLDYVMAKAMVGEGTDYSDLAIVEGIELAVEEYAIGFRLGSSVVEQVNAATKELVADGTLAAIAEKYGQADVLIAG